MRTRDRIGQAKGIIMEGFGVNDLRAFEMLRRLSQEQNIKLHDVPACHRYAGRLMRRDAGCHRDVAVLLGTPLAARRSGRYRQWVAVLPCV